MLKYLGRLLNLNDTPERIAFAFAMGVFLAFSPLLGLHTFLGLTLAFLFGLNRVAVLVGLFVNNPWTLVPIYGAAAYVGGLLVGFPAASNVAGFEWHQALHARFWLQFIRDWSMIKPVVLGSFVLSLVASVLSYPIALFVVQKGKARRQQHGA
jgi:uncharacterized protein (DUF2062 family)